MFSERYPKQKFVLSMQALRKNPIAIRGFDLLPEGYLAGKDGF
jgi:hypothetical protein